LERSAERNEGNKGKIEIQEWQKENCFNMRRRKEGD
jgi:hypothetical protein